MIMLLGLVAKNGILIVDFANHLKNRGYVKFQVNISKLLPPGTYDSSILVITDRGTTVIPVHVVVE